MKEENFLVITIMLLKVGTVVSSKRIFNSNVDKSHLIYEIYWQEYSLNPTAIIKGVTILTYGHGHGHTILFFRTNNIDMVLSVLFQVTKKYIKKVFRLISIYEKIHQQRTLQNILLMAAKEDMIPKKVNSWRPVLAQNRLERVSLKCIHGVPG